MAGTFTIHHTWCAHFHLDNAGIGQAHSAERLW